MLFNNLMHIALYTDQMDEMLDFYKNVLGAEEKVVVKYKTYLHRDDRPYMQSIARKTPEAVFNVYLEIAPDQFVEFFPKAESMVADGEWNSRAGYNHFALTVDDIHATRAELERRGLTFDTEISKGPSGTYQMWAHDPDGNRFEIMQYTEESYQVVGHID